MLKCRGHRRSAITSEERLFLFRQWSNTVKYRHLPLHPSLLCIRLHGSRFLQHHYSSRRHQRLHLHLLGHSSHREPRHQNPPLHRWGGLKCHFFRGHGRDPHRTRGLHQQQYHGGAILRIRWPRSGLGVPTLGHGHGELRNLVQGVVNVSPFWYNRNWATNYVLISRSNTSSILNSEWFRVILIFSWNHCQYFFDNVRNLCNIWVFLILVFNVAGILCILRVKFSPGVGEVRYMSCLLATHLAFLLYREVIQICDTIGK